MFVLHVTAHGKEVFTSTEIFGRIRAQKQYTALLNNQGDFEFAVLQFTYYNARNGPRSELNESPKAPN